MNIAINVIQISALIVFAVLALGYRINHPPGSVACQFDSATGAAYTYEFQTTTSHANGQTADTIVRDANGVPKPKLDAAGKPVPFRVAYPEKDDKGNFLTHPNAASVVGVHNFSWVFIQATVAILILVGFESVTAMGGEAKNAKRDVPIAVITSLLVQGASVICSSTSRPNYFLNSGYTMQSASGSAAPIGDMMVVVGNALFGPGRRPHLHAGGSVHGVPGAHRHDAFLHEHRRARHLCDGQGRGSARAFRPAALREPDPAPRHLDAGDHFGRGRLHRGVDALRRWPALPSDAAIKALPQGFFSSFGYTTHDTMAALPNTLLTVTLASNFGTFLLYALSCIICMVAYHKHPKFSPLRHLFIPLFGLVANLACMVFYLIGPFMGYGTNDGTAAGPGYRGGLGHLRRLSIFELQ